MIQQLGGAVHHAKDSMQTRKTNLTKKLEKHGLNVPYVDLCIQVGDNRFYGDIEADEVRHLR